MTSKKSRLDHWQRTRYLSVFSDISSFFYFALRRFSKDGMSQAAAALTYSTLLALVPLLVIAFAVLSGFPIFDPVKTQMEDFFLGILVPDVGSEIKIYLSEFTRNASNLTAAGIVVLPVTAVMLLSSIESTFNQIWRVDRPRPLVTRLLVFWALLTFGPLLLGASLTLTTDALSWVETSAALPASATSSGWLKIALAVATQSAVFSLLYFLIPARNVRVGDAIIGGVFAALGFQVLRWIFNTFLATSISYSTVYGAVAAVPLFLVWMYFSWTVIILGAVLSASFPDWWRRRDPLIGHIPTQAEKLEIAVALLAALNHQRAGGGAMTPDQLAEAIPLLTREPMIDALRNAGYIVETKNEGLSLARDLSRVSLADLARDLGLPMGKAESAPQWAALKGIPYASRLVPELLHRLKEAEDEILNPTVADATCAHLQE